MTDDIPPKDFREGKRKRVKRPWVVEYRCSRAFLVPRWREWSAYKKYETEKQRNQAFDDLINSQKSYFEFRKIDPERK